LIREHHVSFQRKVRGSPAGYRAQYTVSVRQGEKSNSLLDTLTSLLLANASASPIARGAELSLTGTQAKAWIDEEEVGDHFFIDTPEILFPWWLEGCGSPWEHGRLAVYLFWRVPMLSNPFAVLSRLEANSIPESTLAVSAVLLPMLLIVCLILAFAIVLMAFAHFANERRYLRMIRSLT
jgi:hypothetical protein